MTKTEILELLKETEINSIQFEGLVYVNKDLEVIHTYNGEVIKPTAKQVKELLNESFIDEFGYSPRWEDII